MLEVICEDAKYFLADIKNYIVGICTTTNNGFKQLIDTVTDICNSTGVGVASIITEGGFQIGTVAEKSKLLIIFLLLKLKSVAVLIGGGVWFLVTLIPKLLMTILELLFIGVVNLRDSLIRITLFLVKIIFDAAIFMWNYFVDVPLNCVIGLTVVYIGYRKRSRLWSMLIRGYVASTEVYLRYSHVFRLRVIRTRRAAVQINLETHTPPLLQRLTLEENTSQHSGPSPRKPITRRTISSTSSGSPQSSDTCVVCLERKKTVVVMPCKHLCMCQNCSNQLQQYQSHCPICRENIAELISVYV